MKKLFSEGAHFSLLYRKHVKFAGFNFILFSNSILTAEHIQIGTSEILSQCILILKAEMFSSVQFSSVAQSCPTLCDPMNRSTPGLPVHRQLREFTQTHAH